VLKAHGALDLVVRKGSGIDLFPGESSGYSSASSTADEPTHTLTLRRDEKKPVASGNKKERARPPPPPPPCIPVPPPLRPETFGPDRTIRYG